MDHHPKTGPVARPTKATARTALAGVWALLVGVALLNLGNGLQASLLGLRATQEAFGNFLTGLIMAGFFGGFLLGSRLAARAVRRVGHTRVFAALTAVASITILVHGAFIDPLLWGLLRCITGICFAGIFVAAESWLNQRADNATRGQVLAFYMLASFAGMGGGQLLLTLGDPGEVDLFMLVSVLISAAAVPLLLSATEAPTPHSVRSISLSRLYQVSPLGVVGVFCAGVINGAVFGMGAVYANQLVDDLTRISLFMGALIVGAAAFQWPIGKLSDLFDRRRVLTLITVASAIVAVICFVLPNEVIGSHIGLAVVYGGLALSLHSLAIAYTNDYLEPTELIGASGGLVLVLGAGSIVGPLVVGGAMGLWGAHAFFVVLATVHVALAGFALWRMSIRPPIPTEAQGPYVAVASVASAVTVVAAEALHAEQLTGKDDDASPSPGKMD